MLAGAIVCSSGVSSASLVFSHCRFTIHLFAWQRDILPLLGLCGRAGDFRFFIRRCVPRGASLALTVCFARTRGALFREPPAHTPLQRIGAPAGTGHVCALQTWQTGLPRCPPTFPRHNLTRFPLHGHRTVSDPTCQVILLHNCEETRKMRVYLPSCPTPTPGWRPRTPAEGF